MSFPGLDNQEFSEKTLKGFLLKGIDPNPQTAMAKDLNNYLMNRVDSFWDQIVVPLRSSGKFDGNKINWYFEIYKEGLDAHKMASHPFTYINVTREQVCDLVSALKDKNLSDYLALGTSFLSNAYTVLSSWIRDQMVVVRLEHIYSSENPIDWIHRAEDEEHGIMEKQPDDIEGLINVLNTIGFLMSRRA